MGLVERILRPFGFSRESGSDRHGRRAPYGRYELLFGALLALAIGYTFWRALELRIDYCDSFMYRQSAMRLWGHRVDYFDLRPPLLAALLAPVIELGRALGGSPQTMFRATALEAALLSSLSVVAIVGAMKRPLGLGAALLGGVLFVGNRLFVRYGAHVMTDLITAGTIAAVIWTYCVGRERRHLGWFVLSGVFLGLTALLRYNVALVFPGLVLGELLVALRRWRVHDRAFVGAMLANAVGLAVFLVAHRLVFDQVYGNPSLERFVRIFEDLRGTVANRGGEARIDYLWMGLRALGPVPLVLAAIGLPIALLFPKDEDGVFLGILLAVGTAVLVPPHTEARYALPVLPCVLYFAARAAEQLARLVGPRLSGRPRWVGALVALVVVAATGASVYPAVAQAALDRDPMFRTPAFQEVARYVSESNGRRSWWNGMTTTLCPADPALFPEDDFWNVFHSCVEGLTFYTGTPPFVARERGAALDSTLAQRGEDGDAVIGLSDPTWLDTRDLMRSQAKMQYQLWRVVRSELVLRDGRYEHAGGRRGISITAAAGGGWTVRSSARTGQLVVFARRSATAAPTRLGTVDPRPGRDTPLPGWSGGPPQSVVLLGRSDERVIRAR